jgi:arginyl-tRNA synthetase
MTPDDLLPPSHIIRAMTSTERWSALDELVTLLVTLGKISPADKPAILAAVRAREEAMSTGIGFGIAIPHASSDCVKTTIAAIGCSARGIDFKSIDGAPVRLIALFLFPKDNLQLHLAALKTFSKTFPIAKALAAALSPEEILRLSKSPAPMQPTPAILESRLRAALVAAGIATDLPVSVTPATDTRFGDYQTNIAMLLAKQQRANPRALAQQIIDKLDVASLSTTPEIAGAGFINFRLTTPFIQDRLAAISADPMLGVTPAARPETIIVDFSSPNVAKPMHVGHIRSTILGDTLARIARFLGHTVIADNHIGDWGTQFGKVIYGWKHWHNDAALQSSPVEELVRLYKEANALSETDPAVLTECRDELVKLQQGDPENVAVWQQCVALSWHEFQQMYALLDIHFDEHLGESAYNDRLAPLVQRLLDNGIAEVSEGATCIFFRDDPLLADKPCLIRKSDGGFLYATTDIATIEYRLERWHPDQIWYVVGATQQLHFDQLFAAARKMGIHAQLRFVPFGSILGEDRKLMKTRSGDNVSLKDLLAEAQERALVLVEQKNPDLPDAEKREIARAIGIGAVKYSDLSQARMTDYIFNWDRMLSFQGNTAPYLQNAYVRIRSIFRKLDTPWTPTFVLEDPAELTLAKKLLQFGEVLPQVLDDFRPNILTTYLFELANTYHSFYESCPVLKAPEPARSTRLTLSSTAAKVIYKGLTLLGIQSPEKM